ncbi:D-2-hydroxyacid dehydrogenase family protein [Marinobacterium sp. D7]|uniref:D-2-hydroxyacid dehydrogenase family protein n=1 Tax=Marinobacterium ramblicola TaxID=2849041 RepID=UPI001C2D2894|nr:D-2-hydroxyacid dehydrogenase family protein [Marinobacterium ramblicola]MBV1789435.1 D-2-hydroxyacid dehydrogenase family protein [Marinobacterium ramblicola]
MKIAILDDYQNVVCSLSAFDLLRGHEVLVLNAGFADPAELAARIADAEALVLIRERTSITPELLARLPKLKLISQTGKISNHLDLDACTAAGVAVAEGIGSPVAPAELCWALVMAASRHLPAYAQNLQQGRWQDSGALGLGRTLSGLTFGIWGYGKIGQRVARYAQVFGMRVQVWGSEASRRQAEQDGFSAAPSREAFFETSDLLSLHLRLNEATRHLVQERDLARMQPDALFVNISRAELVAPGALASALSVGRPGFAAVDVFESEPVHLDTEPLLAMPNVLCTPHLGYVEKNSYELYFSKAFENVVNYAQGAPGNIANPEVLPAT